MFGDRLSIASYPMRHGQWAGRVDVPSSSMPLALSTLHAGRNPAQAVVGALRGAVDLCDGFDPYVDDELRLAGLHDVLCGATAEELEEVVGEVGFFGALAPAALSLAAPVASKALSAMGMGAKPGGGGGGGGAPAGPISPGNLPSGTTMTCPGGPIIVRF
jgi:hypothetical protein